MAMRARGTRFWGAKAMRANVKNDNGYVSVNSAENSCF